MGWKRGQGLAGVVVFVAVLVGPVLLVTSQGPSHPCPPVTYAGSVSTVPAGLTSTVRHDQRQVRQATRRAHRQPSRRTQTALRRSRAALQRAQQTLAAWSPATIVLAPGAGTTFALGHATEPGARSFDFTLSRAVPADPSASTRAAGGALRVGLTAFRSTTTQEELSDDSVSAWATLRPDRKAGSVSLCLDSDSRKAVTPGTYTGSVYLLDARVAVAPVPVTLTMADVHVTRVCLICLLVCVNASFYVYFLRRSQIALEAEKAEAAKDDKSSNHVFRPGFGFFWGYWAFVCDAVGVLTVVAGLAAAFGAFGKLYLGSATWEGGVADWATLVGGVASAFIAGGTAGRLAQNIYDPVVAKQKDDQEQV